MFQQYPIRLLESASTIKQGSFIGLNYIILRYPLIHLIKKIFKKEVCCFPISTNFTTLILLRSYTAIKTAV